jgi:hypothetical protein
VAAVASAATTLVIARFGLAGTLLGAALAPVLVALIGEGVRRPAERVRGRTTSIFEGRTPLRARGPQPERSRFTLGNVSWPRVAALGLGAFALVVAGFTLLDLAAGDSPVSDRGSTFFTPGGGGDSPGDRQNPGQAPAGDEGPTSTAPATTTGPATTTEPVTTTQEPAPTTTPTEPP